MKQEIKDGLQRIVEKTYREHALGVRAFGVTQKGGMPSCTYNAGCAIGISLSSRVEDEVDDYPVTRLLDIPSFQVELFGVLTDLPEDLEAAKDALKQVQAAHDHAAYMLTQQGLAEQYARDWYARKLRAIATEYGLELDDAA